MTNTLARQRQIIGSSADWTVHDLVLGDGELAIERLPDGKVKAKVGDGAHPFSGSPYLADDGGSGGSSAIHYMGTTDPTAPPPAGASPGDAWAAVPGGVIAAGWGAPVAGVNIDEGDFLILAESGRWTIVPGTFAMPIYAQRAEHTATAGQTEFLLLAGYVVGYVSVFVNGVKLSASEFTATDGLHIVLAEPAAAGDIVALEGFIGSSTASSDSAAIVFIQAGAGAVPRPAQDKMRERVSLDDFLASVGGNARQALELASAVGKVVVITGAAYAFDRMANIPAGTTLIGRGCTLSAAVGFPDRNLINFVNGGALLGTGTIDGTNLQRPVASWAGATVTPIGAAVVSGTTNDPSGTHAIAFAPVELSGWTFTKCPGGPVFFAHVQSPAVRNCKFTQNQTAGVQFKTSGNYVNVTTTNVLANELITSALVEAYYCDATRVQDNDFVYPQAKGVSVSGSNNKLTGNRYLGGTPRHALEHISGSTGFLSRGSSFIGGADSGFGVKIVNSMGTIGPHDMAAVSYGMYFQDTGDITVIGGTMRAIVNACYAFQHTAFFIAANMRAIEIRGGNYQAAGVTARGFELSGSAEAAAAGYSVAFKVVGGEYRGFQYGLLHLTGGFAVAWDLELIGKITFRDCITTGLDLRCRSAKVDANFINCVSPLVIGNLAGVDGTVMDVTARFEGTPAAGDCCRVAAAAGGGYTYKFKTSRYDLKGFDSGRFLFSMALGAADTMNWLSLKLEAWDMDGNGGRVVNIDAGGKAIKARVDLDLMDAAGGPYNINFVNAATLTGFMKNAIAGVIGAHGLTT